jgi:formate/nitrite transporter FocA (FNT family)
VIGTENKEILILNPAGSTTLVRCRLKDVPAFMAVSGSFDVEYRIVVACRDHKVYTVKVRWLFSALLCSALLCSALLCCSCGTAARDLSPL